MLTSTLDIPSLPRIELSEKETCETFGFSRSHLRMLRQTGELVPIRRGRRLSYNYKALLEFSEKSQRAAERGQE
jgi:hypothetical protein